MFFTPTALTSRLGDMTKASGDARERLIVATEELMAVHGGQVSLRDIAVAAGHRNNSAVNYYFGSRDSLIEAVVHHRAASLERHRLELLASHEASGRADDVPTLVTMTVAPMLTLPYAEGSTHYARFLEQVRNHPVIEGVLADETHFPATRVLTSRLDRAVARTQPGLSQQVRHLRIRAMLTTMVGLLADRERAHEPSRRISEDDLVAMLVGMLTADPVPDVSRPRAGSARRTAARA